MLFDDTACNPHTVLLILNLSLSDDVVCNPHTMSSILFDDIACNPHAVSLISFYVCLDFIRSVLDCNLSIFYYLNDIK